MDRETVVVLCKLAEEGLRQGVLSRLHNVITPPSSFRASEVGTACARYLYHARVDWAKKPGIDARLAGIFAQGTDCEKAVRFLTILASAHRAGYKQDAGNNFMRLQAWCIDVGIGDPFGSGFDVAALDAYRAEVSV